MSKPRKWKVWFKIHREPKWVTAAKEWDSEADAVNHALGKFAAWTMTEDWTVTEAGVDPNAKEEA